MSTGVQQRTLDLVRRHWTQRSYALYTLVDQGMVSLLNFLTTIVVGKLAGADELGLYVLAFTVVVLTSVACDAFVGTPYMARHRELQEDRRRLYSGSVAVHQASLAAVAAVAVVLVAIACAAVFEDSRSAEVWAVLALAVPTVLAREFARRFSIAHMRPGFALAADATAAVLQLAGLAVLGLLGALSAATALAAMALASATAFAVWLAIARPDMGFDRPAIREDFIRNRTEGFWTLAALGTLLVQIFAPTWMLAFLSTAEDVGRFAACQALVMVSNPLVTGLANMIMPRAAAAYAAEGPIGAVMVAVRSSRMLAVAMTLMTGPFIIAGGSLVALLYGRTFSDLGVTVAILALASAVRGLGMSPYVGLWAIGHSRSNAGINVGGSGALLLVLPSLFGQYGLAGAATAALVGDTIAAAARWGVFLLQSRGARRA